MKLLARRQNILVFFHATIVLFVGYLTYFNNYWYPPYLFWDENYRVVSAFQYLNHIMFMEYHPPLGKLFIALGEYIFHPNQSLDTSYFLTVDFIRYIPAGFSFVGVRFFPVLFATCSAVLFFCILYMISKKSTISFLFSSLYLFDNALIVHNRGANLDSIQIFFALALILYFLFILSFHSIRIWHYFTIGIIIGLVASVKLDGFVFTYLLIPLLYYEKIYLKQSFSLQNMLGKIAMFAIGIVLVFCSVYYIHGALGQHVLANRYFSASEAYKTILRNKQTFNPLYLPIIIRDNLIATKKFGDAIPKYDPIFESQHHGTASLPYTWPIGDKSINYRWESIDGTTRYLYLQGNPVIWLAGLLGVISTFALLIAVFVHAVPIWDRKLFFVLQVMFVLYILHMVLFLSLQRVLFLYVYFIPFLLSLIMFFILFIYFFTKLLERKDKRVYGITILFIFCIILSFWFFSPLTYYQPLTQKQFLQRSWFPFWHLQPV